MNRNINYERPIAILISQTFLPGGGGLEQFIDYVALGLTNENVYDVEIICMSKGDNSKESTFDRNYPKNISRVKGRAFNYIQRYNQKFNSLVGGQNRINLKGRISMIIVATLSTYGMLRLTIKSTVKQRRNLTILHCMSISSLFVAVITKKILFGKNIKVIFSNQFTYQSSNFKFADWVIKIILKSTDKIVCVSNYSSNQLIKCFNVDAAKVKVCYSWLNLPRLSTKTLKLYENRKSNDIRVLFVGRIIPEKGISEIIDLAKYLNNNKINNIRLTVIGDSSHPIKQELIKASVKLKCLEYLGRIEKPKLWDYYASNDIFLFPAKSDGEGCNRVIIESYSMGLPVIVTNFKALSEISKLFPLSRQISIKSLKPSKITESIQEVIRTFEKKDKIQFLNNSRRIVAKNFSAKNFEVYDTAYKELLEF